jgi:hypothetical protein
VENETVTAGENQGRQATDPVHGGGINLSLGLTIVALLIWFGFQTTQFIVERSNLGTLKANLDTAAEESEKLRVQLQLLITKTAALADQGNAAAQAVVEELGKKGIPIKAAAQPSK